MTIVPPEVIFDRYFHSGIPVEARVFRGKANLDRLRDSTLPAQLLEDLQRIINEALHNEKPDALHAQHGTYHFDYIDSDTPNAIAFVSEGYAFIGATIALMNELWETSSRLSKAPEVAQVMKLPVGFNNELLHAQLLRLQLFFIVGHEWAHHVHGHPIGSLQADAPTFMDEINVAPYPGDLKSQTREVVADGYSAYYVLQNLIVGDERAKALALLKADGLPIEEQDPILLACFVVAIGGFMFVRQPQELTAATAYGLTHPPQALRLRLLLESAKLWASSLYAPLKDQISPDKFRPLFGAFATATWGMNGGQDWSDQIAFLVTDEGEAYAQKLIEARNAEVRAMGETNR